MNDHAVLIAGATSAIARALAARFAGRGARLHLLARDAAEVERIAADLRIRHGAAVTWSRFEAEDFDTHAALLDEAADAMGGLTGVVVVTGLLGDAARARTDFDHARRIIHANFTGTASLLTHAANRLEAQGHGFIVGLASVAGDRGRQSHYVYGASKGAFALFLQGLRNRLHPSGVRVLTVKPGFVDTAMTFGLPGLFLTAQPEDVADDVLAALDRGKDVLYTPWFWRWVMLGIRLTPERIFKRLRL